MAHLIDLEDVQLVLDERRRKIESEQVLGANTQDGALARHEIDVASACTIWRTKEMNRGTSPEFVIKALEISAVAAIGGCFMQHIEPENRANAAISIAAEFLGDMLTLLGSSGDQLARYSRNVRGKDVGTA